MSKKSKKPQKTGQATQHLIVTPQRRMRDAERRRAEERKWAEKSGPVTVRRKGEK